MKKYILLFVTGALILSVPVVDRCVVSYRKRQHEQQMEQLRKESEYYLKRDRERLQKETEERLAESRKVFDEYRAILNYREKLINEGRLEENERIRSLLNEDIRSK